MHDDYEAPVLTFLGKVADLTMQQQNKVGANADFLTPQAPQVVGSLTPYP